MGTFNGVRTPRSNANVVEILKKDLPLLCNDSYESISSRELTQPKLTSCRPSHKLSNATSSYLTAVE